MSNRTRVDVILVERGLAETREKAQRLIRAGLVYTTSERLDKPGRLVPNDTLISVKGSDCPYVSRGGLKLEGALHTFGVEPRGRVAVDLGASTGGFTDCLLQSGARRVFTIDVGRNQLHEKLRSDPRVTAREKTHIDSLEAADFDEPPTLAVADLSFISLRRAYAPLRRLLAPNAEAILLVKPQFEVGKENVPRGGVITDERLQQQVLSDLAEAAALAGFAVLNRCESPIQGGDGNREFFLYVQKP